MSLMAGEADALEKAAMEQGETGRARRLRELARRGWLSMQPAEFQDRMIAIGRWVAVARGRPIYVRGEPPDAIYGLGSGLLDVSFPVDADEDMILHRAPPGFWIGDGALLSETPRLLTVVAAMDCALFRIPAAPLRRSLTANPGDWRFFHHLATMNAMLAIQALAEQSLRSRPRFARILLRLAAADGTVNATQAELGRMAGMSRASFRRAFGDLIAAGAIETDRGVVRIHDRPALERQAKRTS